jgi:hypothetical protein
MKIEKLTLKGLQTKLSQVGSNEDDSYLVSPTYYNLTGRSGGWLCSDKNSAAVVIRHPQMPNSFIIFPEMGQTTDCELTVKILQSFTSSSLSNTTLGRYTDEKADALQSKLAKLKTGKVLEKADEDIMDWKYPIQIIDTQLVSELGGSNFAQLRQQYRRAGTDISIASLDKDGLSDVQSVLRAWKDNKQIKKSEHIPMLMAGEGWDIPDFDLDGMGYYRKLLQMVEANPKLIEGLRFMKNGQLIGFTAWETLKNKTSNLFANLTDQTAGLSDFQMVNTCRHLQKAGIKSLNLGGSETASLDKYKKKFCPTKSIQEFTFNLT